MYEEKVVGIDELFLDKKNYRIDFERYDTEEKAVDRLYLDEDIMGMIKGIVNQPGLYPHEKMIAIPKEKGGYTVLEGNRRLLATKSLLGIIKPPAKYAREVAEQLSKLDDNTKESLKRIGVVIYELGDKGYLKILADKHSSVSYQRWGQISQWHFFKDLYDMNEKNLVITSKDLGKSKNDVSNYIKFYNLFSYIRSLTYWDEKNLRDNIESNTLKATKFTRPLGFSEVKNALGIDYDEHLEVKIPDEDVEKFNEILCKYAEAALILDDQDDDFIYTRSEPGQVVELINGWKKEYRGEGPEKREAESGEETGENIPEGEEEPSQNSGEKGKKTTGKKRGRKKGRRPKYWGTLECNIDDDRLIFLSDELSNIPVSSFPGASVMLSRALIESCLKYQIEKYDKWDDFKNSCKRDCNLDSMINYALNNKNDIFSNPKYAEPLKYLQGKGGHRVYMNDIIHGNPVTPTPAAVEAMAGDVRQLIKSILADEE